MDDTIGAEIDLNAVRAKYEAERVKRIRRDHNEQYVQITGEYAHLEEDPYIEKKIDRPALKDTKDVIVIGGGFGGLLAGARLRKAGFSDLRIIEKGGDFGGTWYWNRYPGAQCDIESYVYLPLLEETGYMPTLKYAFGDEIHAHTKRIADHFDLYRDVCFQTQVTKILWHEDEGQWEVQTDMGDSMRAKYVCMANGPLNKPRLPGIPGIEGFKGHMFHTSRWDYDYTGGSQQGGLDKLHDKKVAIIGTGATALQCVPALGEGAEHLYVVQRTPSSVDERLNSETDPDWAASLAPGWQAERIGNFCDLMSQIPCHEDLVDDRWTDMVKRLQIIVAEKASTGAFTTDQIEELAELADFESMEAIRQRVESVVEDPATAERLKAYYRKLCKRPSFHDQYLPTFNRPNVTLVDTDGQGLTRITENAIIFNEWEYQVDCIVFATGFEVGTDYTRRSGYDVIGKGGQSLSEAWKNGPKTQFGIHANGFPNLFFMGPINGATSFTLTQSLNEQAQYIAHTMSRAEEAEAKQIEVSPAAQADWAARVAASGVDERTDFFETCTPGYYNGEGEEGAKSGFWQHEYAGGPSDFHAILHDWQSVSHLPGLLVDGKPLKPTDKDKQYLKSKASIRTRLHREMKAFLHQADFMGAPEIGSIPVEMMRQMSAMGATMRPKGPKIQFEQNASISADGHDIPVRIYKDCDAPEAIVLYFHGGGWCMGSLEEYDAPMRRIAADTKAAVVSVDYRLAPEHPFPAAIDDAIAALKWTASERESLARAGAPLIVAGDSAGGNISAVLSIVSRDILDIQIDGQVLIYPSVDLDVTDPRMDAFESPLLNKHEIEWFVDQYVPHATDREDARFRPLLAASHENLPPALILTAEFDLLRFEGEAYRDKLERSGVPVTYQQADGALHAYFSLTDGQTHSLEAHDAIQSFIRNLRN